VIRIVESVRHPFLFDISTFGNTTNGVRLPEDDRSRRGAGS
jgi:hypothetical protein